MNGIAFMTSPIGDLPVNSDGLRKAVDTISELQADNLRLQEERDAAIVDLVECMSEYAHTCKYCINGIKFIEEGTCLKCEPKWRGLSEKTER